MRKRLTGVLPPIPTTFDATGKIDRRSLTDNVRRWMRSDLAGVLALGSNGEAALLDEDECDVIVETARESVPGDRVLLAGVGRESTRLTIAAAKRAAKAGADAVLVRAPAFYKTQMTPDALYAHFNAVADASPVPVMLYNLPASGVTLTLPVVSRLAEHPNVIGLKETSPDLERLVQFTAIRPGGFQVMCGWAPVFLPALAAGASGGILAVANVVPTECVRIYECVKAGRLDEARELQQRLIPLAQLVTTGYGIAGLKIALELAGFHGGPVRAPLLPATSKVREEIAAALTHFKDEESRRGVRPLRKDAAPAE